MAQVISYEDIPPERVMQRRGGDRANADLFPFIGDPLGGSGPNAFLVRFLPDSISSSHFHAVDQVQIVTEGNGKFGRHEMKPFQLHFSRAYTPYGPLVPEAGKGWSFLNLRTRPDPEGAQKLSMAREKLLNVEDRRPFQVTCQVIFPASGGDAASLTVEGLQNDEGLAGLAITLPPSGHTLAPSAAGTDGQYIVIVKGHLRHGGRTLAALTVVHVEPGEEPFVIRAGEEGLQAIAINFPRVQATPVVSVSDTSAADKVWCCVLCDFTYDESRGLPEDGIAPGTRWEDVPDTWSCPDCGATKADFELVEF